MIHEGHQNFLLRQAIVAEYINSDWALSGCFVIDGEALHQCCQVWDVLLGLHILRRWQASCPFLYLQEMGM